MNRKALLIALAAALLGGACLFLYMQRFEAETSGGPKVKVLMATRDIPFGTALTREMLGVRMLPQAYVEQRHIRLADLESVLGARLSMTVRADEALLWSDLSSMQAERRELSGLIEQGQRALTIMTQGDGLFGGLLRPGDRVDILFSPDGGLTNGAPATITLLQNVVVLAVGADTGAEQKHSSRGRAVTVSLSPEQSQLVVRARAQGKLDVVLRNPEDIVVLKDLPETVSDDIREAERRQRFAQRKPAPAPATATAPEGGPREIERIR